MSGENQFKEGDTVQLKSGGPIMTVEKGGTYGGQYKLACIWFEGSKKMQGTFSPSSLTAA
jgi:uncharacterized protein YodC (DUF2158 family)